MTQPRQRAIVYRNGLRKKTPAQYADEYRMATDGYFECPRCKRPVRKGETGNLKKHFSDFPNRIHCPAGIDKQGPGGKTGPRGPYGPRKKISDE